ncbi:hypothetical protein EJ05DRAFT_480797 [Pseudovirgaria hyperparasitica]|uniref:Uncharacterized protein n=1 Tax=Pseudovirgaria hyperparasitica TaxID=470096 RepID=A0A6A6VQS2_9PEZI|nr:uncharacterized protein EJ05DRAFT_480797 [Pseudovirgaria hyperparasitica]KAF2752952.1 hypothetical protein EJ05DRAFT_480797 [Pseudovirgaria hyperparasitica]
MSQYQLPTSSLVVDLAKSRPSHLTYEESQQFKTEGSGCDAPTQANYSVTESSQQWPHDYSIKHDSIIELIPDDRTIWPYDPKPAATSGPPKRYHLKANLPEQHTEPCTIFRGYELGDIQGERPVVIKLWYADKEVFGPTKPEVRLESYFTEVQAYTLLQRFQGLLIPELYGSYMVASCTDSHPHFLMPRRYDAAPNYRIFALVREYIDGKSLADLGASEFVPELSAQAMFLNQLFQQTGVDDSSMQEDHIIMPSKSSATVARWKKLQALHKGLQIGRKYIEVTECNKVVVVNLSHANIIAWELPYQNPLLSVRYYHWLRTMNAEQKKKTLRLCLQRGLERLWPIDQEDWDEIINHSMFSLGDDAKRELQKDLDRYNRDTAKN